MCASVGGWGRIGLCLPPENKEGAAGRFPFVANGDKQGLVMSRSSCLLGHCLQTGRDT